MKNTGNILVGSWDKLPHYCIVGSPTSLYAYVNEDDIGYHSEWVTGKEAFKIWYDLKKIKDKDLLVTKIKQIYNNNLKKGRLNENNTKL